MFWVSYLDFPFFNGLRVQQVNLSTLKQPSSLQPDTAYTEDSPKRWNPTAGLADDEIAAEALESKHKKSKKASAGMVAGSDFYTKRNRPR